MEIYPSPKKSKIICDFKNKHNTYYEKNYCECSPSNYLRQLRNFLIKKELQDVGSDVIVLDVGCGPAILYDGVLSRSLEYYALDISPDNIKQIKKLDIPKVKPILSDFENINIFDVKFDVIICSGSLEYMDDPIGQCKKLVRMLNDDGLLVASFPSSVSPYRVWGEYIYKHIYNLKRWMHGEENLYYERVLVSKKKLTSEITRFNNCTIRFIDFGYKLLLQPLDIIFSQMDYKILKFLQEKHLKILSFTTTEYLMVLSKNKDVSA